MGSYSSILYKTLLIVELVMSVSYIMAIIKILILGRYKTIEIFNSLRRTALSNYILQTVFMVFIFYSFDLVSMVK
jgi:uncharacterized protein